jgi:hypothetical protein
MIEADWQVTFLDFIKENKLPPSVDPKSAEAARILRWSKGYVLVKDNLHKRGSTSEKYSRRFTKTRAETMLLLAR